MDYSNSINSKNKESDESKKESSETPININDNCECINNFPEYIEKIPEFNKKPENDNNFETTILKKLENTTSINTESYSNISDQKTSNDIKSKMQKKQFNYIFSLISKIFNLIFYWRKKMNISKNY